MNGSPATLYITLAGLYENNMKNPTEARSVYERICRPMPEYSFRDVDDLAQCFASYVEMELRLENWDGALSIARRSVSHLPSSNSTKISRGLMKSLRLWNLLLDLEESLGTIQTTKDAYNRALEIKVATPSHVINFASYLADKKYFEESFTAYERGVDLFPFPHAGAKILWKEYLSSFYKRYGGTKIFRMRELFDRCLESCPPSDASEFFILYGKFEEEYGLAKRALGVYERMCTVVPPEEKFSAYELFITKTIKYGGITATRPIYERAIAALEDHPASIMCCAYAKMESSLNEIDRARAAFTYGAQLADPRRNPEYWGDWHEFEVSHGNEDTFREMLRVKRGVQAAFSTVNYNAAEMGAGVPKVETLTDDQALEMIAAREGVDAYEKERISGFVQGKRTKEMKDMDEVERRAAKLRKITAGNMAVAMPSEEKKPSIQGDEIDIGSSDEDDEGDEGVQQANVTNHTIIKDVNTKAIPAAVFGGLASQL
jgi:pre-mRNA-splicing factor SYF1